ncbi:hypothetical protein INR77_14335 [Erythrobacter sp. SCSIO 43205]|uniref:hypothetical protein n=1 Tax=Erythrobacter sp. SCSIO 43205 TaxID=2779361 RepID=UPI001CA984D4|nr:hypothetical protein [Erythrobacter sp. SCSIO 43205]UAB77931.1 hypothetical protein INR77_14335 [Erythrobacter sp. SCSIO 43205]
MHLFEILIVMHVITGLTGLIAFWVPIVAKKGAVNHRRWGRICAYGFIGAGTLAVIMALISLYGPEERIPSITDRVLFDGLFGWMMLYLGLLTIGFADYGLAVVKHSRNREALREARYQIVIAAVLVSAAYCFWYGFHIGEMLMMAVAVLGIAAMSIQELFIWRKSSPSRKAYVGEHFRALIGMGISAYTAFMSVGLIRYIPEHVFNPLVWALPSTVGVALIIGFSLQAKRQAQPKAPPKPQPTSA